MQARNLRPDYADTPEFIEDNRFVDTRLPCIVTPTFLDWSPTELANSGVAHDLLLKSFPWNQPGVWKLEDTTYSPHNNYKHPVNKWLNQRYTFNMQRVFYKGREWVESMGMICWHLNNGYKLHAMPACVKTKEERSDGYYYLNLIFRSQNDSHLPATGATELAKFVKYLAEMPENAPPAVYYYPQQIDSYYSPHLDHLEYQRGLDTEQLTKLWRARLRGVPVPDSSYWLAGIYKPVNPAKMPEEIQFDKFEEVINQMKATQ